MENKHQGPLLGATPRNTQTNNSNPAFYTIREVAELLRLGVSTRYRIIREGDFPAIRLSSRYVVTAAALDRLLAQEEAMGGVVDPAHVAVERRTASEVVRNTGGEPW
jgi:excisionase family DNA binding protein